MYGNFLPVSNSPMSVRCDPNTVHTAGYRGTKGGREGVTAPFLQCFILNTLGGGGGGGGCGERVSDSLPLSALLLCSFLCGGLLLFLVPFSQSLNS